MSKIGQHYLMKQEKALEHMQEVQSAMNDAQDCHVPENDRFWVDEDKDKKYQKHCDELLQPF